MPLSTTRGLVDFDAVGVACLDGEEVVRGLLRDGAVVRLAAGLGESLAVVGDGETDGDAVLLGNGTGSSGAGVVASAEAAPFGVVRGSGESVEVRYTAPAVPPTTTATATAAVAAIPVGDGNFRSRACLPVIGPSFQLPTNRFGP